ncbi:MAG: hypothetical protein IRZ03_10600 [Acidobacterium ailaaui]|nr:hypothetical protein [Pseudacidobacterium ailaaui]
MAGLVGQWSNTLNTFWYGANGCEFIAFKGSYQILVFPTDEYPKPPSQIIHHTDKIETLRDFNEALEKGVWYDACYKKSRLVGKGAW